jgi:hypothetical protein
MNRDRVRKDLLGQFSDSIARAAASGALTGKPVTLLHREAVAGPRAGALELHCGLDSGKMLKALAADDCALLRQFVPWSFQGDPLAFFAGRHLRLEAGWPGHLADDMIRLTDLGEYPKDGARWFAGRNESGQKVTMSFERAAHWLVAGETGAGKSVAIRSAVIQLARDPDVRLVLADGKWGDGLGNLNCIPRLVGPVATDLESIRGALSWAVSEMRRRYETGDKRGRVIVVFDEFQEYLADVGGDPLCREMTRRLVAQGRAAGVHCILSTQHPSLNAFGDDSTRRNLNGRLALRVGDPDASRVVVGAATPRADKLLGKGDSYVVAPGIVHRMQAVYTDQVDIAQLQVEEPFYQEWPMPDAEAAGALPEDDGPNWSYSPQEDAVGLVVAFLNRGRPTLQNMLERAGLSGRGRPGSKRADRLLSISRERRDALRSMGASLCHSGASREIVPYVGAEDS